MFADSLIESGAHSGHRMTYSKLISTLLQTFSLAIALAIPVLHVQRLQIIPPVPSIRLARMTPVVDAQPQQSARSYSANPPSIEQIVQPPSIPSTIERLTDHGEEGPAPAAPPCIGTCGGGIPVANLLSAGTTPMVVQPPHPPQRPLRVSEMKLGDLVHKVIPDYPIVAKQLGIQGKVVLLALVGKDGRVERVQVISGPPLLVQPAIRTVEQWQYRPYLLNHEPVEVQTQVTVNFVLNR